MTTEIRWGRTVALLVLAVIPLACTERKAAPRRDASMEVRDAGMSIRDATLDHDDAVSDVDVHDRPDATRVIAPLRCMGHRGHDDIARETVPCRARTVARVVQWRPDAIVVLGGGMLADGAPNCATVQRGALAAQLVAALDEAGAAVTAVLLTGDGHTQARPLDALEARCVSARLDGTATVARTGTRRSLTEADAMCAAMLRATDTTQREALLARMRFEARASSTDQNALFTRTMIERGGYARVLVLTSPVLKRFARGVDVHADRALDGFRAVRSRARGRWALAALGCPMFGRLSTFYAFEPVATMPEGMFSEPATAR